MVRGLGFFYENWDANRGIIEKLRMKKYAKMSFYVKKKCQNEVWSIK